MKLHSIIIAIALGASMSTPCEYCSSLSGTINGGATAIGFRAASSRYSIRYEWWLNNSCEYDKEERYKCPKPMQSGPFSLGLASSWFIPNTNRYYIWAIRNGKGCSKSRIITLPAIVNIYCVKVKLHAYKRTGSTKNRHRLQPRNR